MKKLRRLAQRSAWALAFILSYPIRAASAPDAVAKPTVDLSIYRHVVHVGWVVKDLDRVVNYWERLGLKDIHRVGAGEIAEITYRGKKTKLRRKLAWGEIGGVKIVWTQPLEAESAGAEFLRRHGDGIEHLAYAVGSPEQLDAQIKYFRSGGVEVMEEESWESARGKGRLACLNTAPQGGGLAIELIYNPELRPSNEAVASPNEYPFNKITQYAYLVRNIKKVASFYERLGFGGMPTEHNISVNRSYRGQPGNFEMYLGWWNWGDVTFEWIEPLLGPSVYDEYLKAHGEGLHHLAFEVADIDRAVELLKAKGAPVSQSGGWDSPNSKGRFAYLDTEPHGGVTIELLWNQPPPR